MWIFDSVNYDTLRFSNENLSTELYHSWKLPKLFKTQYGNLKHVQLVIVLKRKKKKLADFSIDELFNHKVN